ncbi:MAG: AarF/UbiB family protein [Clostridia bacterium]|nr:AarF/UbiB family protein [Clostridia bacterium]
MENNKDREVVQAPADDAAENKLENQAVETAADVQPVNEPDARRAEQAETERALQEAQTGAASGKAQGPKASKDNAEARKARATQKRQVKAAERREKIQKQQEAVMKSKEELAQELERRKAQLQHTKAQMSDKLRQMLSDEIEAMKKRQKTRSAEILAIFAKHNFYANGFTPVELRTTLEDLGPTYVKIGQIMSSRVDMLPESYCKELEKLRQNVKELDPEIARAVIEQETGRKIEDIFLEFRDKPLGSASIGQAHYAVLKDGTRVVAKVQRPLIADMMREDFALLKKLAKIVNTVGEANENDDQMIDLLSVIEELEKVEEEELDFRVEAENTRFFKEHCIDDEEKISCPTVIDELTTERLFTMTFVDGYSISKRDRLIEEGYDPEKIGSVILDNYLHQVLDVGTFHGDPHQGNIMVSHGKPVWIDFGMIGRITEGDVSLLQSLILSLVERDLDALVNAIMSMGATSPKTNRNKLVEDADVMFDKYMNVTNLNDLDLSAVLEEVTDLASKHHISLPGKYTMLVRSIATIEGVIEQLCPELNLFQQITDKLMERVKKNLDVGKELLSAGKDVLEVGRKVSRMPSMAYDALNNALKGRLKMSFELTGYEEILKSLGDTVKSVVLALFACILFIGSCILSTADIQPKTPDGQPLIAAVGMLFSVALGIYTAKHMSKKK